MQGEIAPNYSFTRKVAAATRRARVLIFSRLLYIWSVLVDAALKNYYS
jgi:hypothetical protein